MTQQVGWHHDAGYKQIQGSHLLKEFANCVCGCQNGLGGDCHY
jgi:hypothetical protein